MHFYAMSLIHDLFPDHTVGILGAADLRIRPNGGVPEFLEHNGAPVTVLQRVAVDPSSASLIDSLVSGAYADFRAYQDGTLVDRSDTIASIRDRWDGRIIAEFGPELEDTLRKSGGMQSMDRQSTVHTALRYAKKTQPHSVVTHMLEYGIVPSHPAMNFLPTERREGLRPYGRFIELQIVDADRLRQRLETRGDADHELRKLRRFQIMQGLDFDYTLLLKDCHQSVIDNPKVQLATYRYLRIVERYFSTLPRDLTLAMISSREQCAQLAARYGQDAEKYIAALERAGLELDDQIAYDQFVCEVDSVFQSIPVLAPCSKESVAYRTFLNIIVFVHKKTEASRALQPLFLEAFRHLTGSQASDVEVAEKLNEIKMRLRIE